jgi:hypothetical protein
MEGTPNLPVSFAKWYLQKTLKSKFKHLYYIIMIMSFSFSLLDMYVLDITLFFFTIFMLDLILLLIRSSILSRPENIKRGRCRPKLSWEEAIKRYLKE